MREGRKGIFGPGARGRTLVCLEMQASELYRVKGLLRVPVYKKHKRQHKTMIGKEGKGRKMVYQYRTLQAGKQERYHLIW